MRSVLCLIASLVSAGVVLDCYVSARCVAFDCYVGARFVVLFFNVTFLRAVLCWVFFVTLVHAVLMKQLKDPSL